MSIGPKFPDGGLLGIHFWEEEQADVQQREHLQNQRQPLGGDLRRVKDGRTQGGADGSPTAQSAGMGSTIQHRIRKGNLYILWLSQGGGDFKLP